MPNLKECISLSSLTRRGRTGREYQGHVVNPSGKRIKNGKHCDHMHTLKIEYHGFETETRSSGRGRFRSLDLHLSFTQKQRRQGNLVMICLGVR